MNVIQQISRNLENRKLKLQMGLDLSTDIDTHSLRAMWRQLNLERLQMAGREALHPIVRELN